MILTKDNISNFNQWYDNTNISGGFGIFFKDKGWTSMDLVAKLRRLSGVKKVGHCGTLDPLATGLMIIAFGKATKQVSDYSKLPKSYLATLKFGARTQSFDSELPEIDLKSIDDLDQKKIENVLKFFLGKIIQKPPIYSAKSYKGKKLYKLIRNKEEINNDTIEEIREIKKNQIEIYSISLKEYYNGIGVIDVRSSAGTYIRTLADDIGCKLGCGAYLLDLTRTSIGDFNLNQCLTVRDFEVMTVRNI